MRLDPITLPTAANKTDPVYATRNFRPGDEPAWLELLQSGGFDPWNRARLDRLIEGERTPLPPEAIFFATQEDRPVGVTNIFTYHQEQHGIVGELGWVVVHPEHRGHGLAYRLGLESIAYADEKKHRHVFLETEDFRLAAIKTYLKLGFKPNIRTDSDPTRWQVVRDQLALM